VIGFLSSVSPGPWTDLVAAFRKGLNEAGFVEGQNVAIEYCWAEGRKGGTTAFLPWPMTWSGGVSA
jgi:hypothetical protein